MQLRECNVGPSGLIEDAPGLESDQHDDLRLVNKNIPEVAGLEGWCLGGPSAGAHVDNGLSDLEEMFNDDEVVETFNLLQFASALQEAQCCAIQLENEIVKTKRKWLKT